MRVKDAVIGVTLGLLVAVGLVLFMQGRAEAQRLDIDLCIIDPLCVVVEVEVPVERIVERIVEVPVEVIREVERIVEVPVPGPTEYIEVEVPVPGPTEYIEVPADAPEPEPAPTVTEAETVEVPVVPDDPDEAVDPAAPDDPDVPAVPAEPAGPDEVIVPVPEEDRTVVRRVFETVADWPWWVYLLAVGIGAGVGGLFWYYRVHADRDRRINEDLEDIRDVRRPHT